MKRFVCLILVIATIIGATACASSNPEYPGNFYYRRPEIYYFGGSDGVVAPEERDLADIHDDLDAMLVTYFAGPVSSDLESPFPRDTAPIDWNMNNTRLTINLNEEFSQLSGIDLTIACACIAKTFLELTEATSVCIRADGAMLNGSDSIVISENSLSLTDNSIDQLRTEMTLYYTDADRRYLIGQSISVSLTTQSDLVSFLVDQLMKPPADLGLVTPLPAGTKLLGAKISDGVCALDLSAEFENNGFSQSYAQRTTLLSLVNTLTQMEDVEKVEFYIEGNLIAQYCQLNVSKALVFDENIIGPVRTGVNEFDATLYLSNGSKQYLAAVPTRIRQTAAISQAELVVNELIHYENENGFFTTIPSDTVLNALTLTDGLCIIDLSSDFLENTDHLTQSVHSIIASVCALEGVNMAMITVDGETPEGDFGNLFSPMTPNSNWYL